MNVVSALQGFSCFKNIPLCVYDKTSCDFTQIEGTYLENKKCLRKYICDDQSDKLIFVLCGLYYGKIDMGDSVLIVGPVSDSRMDEAHVDAVAAMCSCLCNQREELFAVPEISIPTFEHLIIALQFMNTGVETEDTSIVSVGCVSSEGELKGCSEYIAENIENNISLETISSAFGYTPSYFSRKFKQVYGMNLSKYLIKVKLEKSLNYLRYTDRSLVDISTTLWFSSQSHFQNVFKTYYGMTPMEYRRKYSVNLAA